MMNKYSTNSRKNLQTTHPEHQLLFGTVLVGWDHSILYGHRGKELQNELFAKKRSKLQFPDSSHNEDPSMGCDAAPYLKELGGTPDGSNPKHLKYFRAFSGYVLGVADMLRGMNKMEYMVRWGGDWDSDRYFDDQSFNDLYHFELILPSSTVMERDGYVTKILGADGKPYSSTIVVAEEEHSDGAERFDFEN